MAEKKYQVVKFDKDYDTAQGPVTGPLTKSEAKDVCDLLKKTTDPLENVRFEVEEFKGF